MANKEISTLPAAAALDGTEMHHGDQSNDSRKVSTAQTRDYVWKKLVTTAGAGLTLATDIITVTHSWHTVDTQAAASTDDLVTINGGEDGMHLFLSAVDSAHSIVVKDGTGNIQCAGDFTMDHVNDVIHLIFVSALSAWLEVSRSDNSI